MEEGWDIKTSLPIWHCCSGMNEKKISLSYSPRPSPICKKSISIKIKNFSRREESGWAVDKEETIIIQSQLYRLSICWLLFCQWLLRSVHHFIHCPSLSFNRETHPFTNHGSEFQAHSRNRWIFTSAGRGPSPELIPLSQILSKSCDLFSTDFVFFQLILHIDIGA